MIMFQQGKAPKVLFEKMVDYLQLCYNEGCILTSSFLRGLISNAPKRIFYNKKRNFGHIYNF